MGTRLTIERSRNCVHRSHFRCLPNFHRLEPTDEVDAKIQSGMRTWSMLTVSGRRQVAPLVESDASSAMVATIVSAVEIWSLSASADPTCKCVLKWYKVNKL